MPSDGSKHQVMNNLRTTSRQHLFFWGSKTSQGFLLVFGASQLLAIASAVVTGLWITLFREGFSWNEETDKKLNYHYLFGVMGCALFLTEGILVYKVFRYESKSKLKLLHMGFQILLLVFTLLSLIAVFDVQKFVKGKSPTLSTVHSWIGLITTVLIFSQFSAGFMCYFFPGGSFSQRNRYRPFHLYIGIAIFMLSIVTLLTGFAEVFAVEWKAGKAVQIWERIMINGLGVALIVLTISVIFIVLYPAFNTDDSSQGEDNHSLLNTASASATLASK